MTGFTFDAPTVIRTKRDGGVLSNSADDGVIDAIPPARRRRADVGAADMAIFLRELYRRDRQVDSRHASGERSAPSLRPARASPEAGGQAFDGGVGDKITIPLVPIVMAVAVRYRRWWGRVGPHRRYAGQIGGHHRRDHQRPDPPNNSADLGAAIFAALLPC